MKIVFSSEESKIVGYSEIELHLSQFEFNTKLVQAPKETEYMGDDETEMALAYTISISGINPGIKTIKK